VVIEGKGKRNTPLNPLLIEGKVPVIPVLAGKSGRGDGGEQAGKRLS